MTENLRHGNDVRRLDEPIGTEVPKIVKDDSFLSYVRDSRSFKSGLEGALPRISRFRCEQP